MTPAEIDESLRFLEDLLREHGMAWVVRAADVELEEDSRPHTPDPQQRLVAVIDHLVRVLVDTDELERALPELLLEGTGADVLVRYDGEQLISEASLSLPTGAPSPVELERTVVALSELRELAQGER